jgi:diguanylate cyclase (GGDEF)-like protein
MDIEVSFYLTILSIVFIFYIFIKTLCIKTKFNLHYAFLGSLFILIIWCLGTVIQYLFLLQDLNNYLYTGFIGPCFIPPFIWMIGYFFANPEKDYKKRFIFFFVVPLISLALVITNPYHKLFITNYSFLSDQKIFTPYFYFHSLYSYSLITIGMGYLIRFSIKNSSIFSKQALLIIIGTSIAVIVNIVSTFNIFQLSNFSFPISFTICLVFYWLAIIKYDFLNIIPIALKQIVNQISDGFLVLSRDLRLVDYNKTIQNMFANVLTLKPKDNIFPQANQIGFRNENIQKFIGQAVSENRTVTITRHIVINDFNKYFDIELTPLFIKQKHIGTIVLFKDITERKRYIETLEIKNNKLDEMNAELQAQNEEIEDLNIKLKELAEIDGLTGAYNRRFFNEYYEIEIIRSLNQMKYNINEKTEIKFGIAIIDIDDFKRVNDLYGHLVGDNVLKQVVNVIKQVTFSRDIVCRYGGEEFAVIFTKTTKEGALTAAEKIREEIDKHHFYFNEDIKDGHITISIGLAIFDDDYGVEGKNILKVADERLYQAKIRGKNRVVYQ